MSDPPNDKNDPGEEPDEDLPAELAPPPVDPEPEPDPVAAAARKRRFIAGLKQVMGLPPTIYEMEERFTNVVRRELVSLQGRAARRRRTSPRTKCSKRLAERNKIIRRAIRNGL